MSETLDKQVQRRHQEGEPYEDIATDLNLSPLEVSYLGDAKAYDAVQRALSRPASERRSRPSRAPQPGTD